MTLPQIELSIVIVTHNVASLIGDCLRSVERECAGMAHEVFVVDSASTDATVSVVETEFPDVTLIVNRQNVGFSAGNNQALSRCRGRFVVLLNPDTLVHTGGLRLLIRHLETHPQVAMVGPTLRLGDGDVQPQCAQNLPSAFNMLPWLLLLDKAEWMLRFRRTTRAVATHPPREGWFDRWMLLYWDRSETCEVEMVCGACMMFRREVLDSVGILDEAAPLYLDDIDFCRRIRNAGGEIHFVSEACVTHLWQQSSAKLQRDADFFALVCHSIWLYLRKHDGAWAAATFSSSAILASLLRLAVGLPALLATGGAESWRRHVVRALALGRWATRIPKRPPRFGFACESLPPSEVAAAVRT